MRKTYRAHGGSKEYWDKRWSDIPADDGNLNFDRYPGRYAEAAAKRTTGEILEAGCGAGRVLIHYHRAGRKIVGMDYIATAIEKISAVEPDIPVYVGDIRELPFENSRFEVVLAFGLYHSIEEGVEKALMETKRVLQPGGLLVASVRADNVQNRIVDYLAARRAPKNAENKFHKANYTRSEFSALLDQTGFEIETVEYVENMPFLYKFRMFRHPTHRNFNETVARGEGYRLSWFGSKMQTFLIKSFPASFCNIMVFTARAKA